MNSEKKKHGDSSKEKEKKEENIHKGHRERFRQRFSKSGIEAFSFHEKIEFLLFYAKPQVNTNEEAHILAEAFNESLVDIFEADIEVLRQKGKLSKNVALYIKFLHELIKAFNLEKIDYSKDKLGTFEGIKQHLIIKYSGVELETVSLLCINSRMEIIADDIIHVGSVNSAFVNAGKIAKIAFLNNASGVVLAHNHPGGIPVPSPEDIATTRKLKSILLDVNINLIEHYVVADNAAQAISHCL